jgi:flagellin
LLTGNLKNTLNVTTDPAPNGISVADFSGAKAGSYELTFEKVGTTTPAWFAVLSNTADPSTTQRIDVSSALDVSNGEITCTEPMAFDFNHFGISIALETGTDGVDAWKVDGATLGFDIEPGSLVLQIGANKDQNMDVVIGDMRAEALGLTDLTGNLVDVTKFNASGFDFNTQLDLIDKAISAVSTQRSELGAYQNRLEHTINNLDTAAENLDAANSRIRDVDMALEMANFTRHQILQQAGTAMLAQANVTPQAILKLLG